MKPREFYLKFNDLCYDSKDCEVTVAQGTDANVEPHETIFVREVVPIDWEKVWEGIRQWSLPIDELESAKQMQDKIQELVEKQIKGEE